MQACQDAGAGPLRALFILHTPLRKTTLAATAKTTVINVFNNREFSAEKFSTGTRCTSDFPFLPALYAPVVEPKCFQLINSLVDELFLKILQVVGHGVHALTPARIRGPHWMPNKLSTSEYLHGCGFLPFSPNMKRPCRKRQGLAITAHRITRTHRACTRVWKGAGAPGYSAATSTGSASDSTTSSASGSSSCSDTSASTPTSTVTELRISR